MPCAGAGEENEHPGDGDTGEEDDGRRRRREQAEGDTGVLHVMDRERPDDVHRIPQLELRSNDRLRHLVGDDCRQGDGNERDPLAPPRGKRTPGGPLGDDPVRRRPDPNLGVGPASLL